MRSMTANRRMEYREWPAPAALQRHIQCAWRLNDPAPAAGVRTIYPDGRCELIVHLATPPRTWDATAGWREQAPTLFAAQHASAVRLESTEAMHCIGLRLQPAASALLVPRGLARLRDRAVDLASIDSTLSVALRRAARSFVEGDSAPLWRVALERCEDYGIDPRIEAAVAELLRSGGTTRIGSLAREARLSMRGFQTLFRARVGLVPKEFARLLRLQATLRAIEGGGELAVLAADAGYSDQAHATREIKRVTGLTPARLRAELSRDRDGDAAVRLAAAFVRGASR
jgi:AraC-like DNA-binding protein